MKHDVKEFFRFFLLLPAVFTRPSHESGPLASYGLSKTGILRLLRDEGERCDAGPLTNDRVEVARKLYEHGHPIAAIATRLDTSPTTSGGDSSRTESSHAHAAVATGDSDRFPPPPSPLRFEQARATRPSARRSQSSAEPAHASPPVCSNPP